MSENQLKDIYKTILNQSLTALDFSPVDITSFYSWKAGCDCGCSPGFILNGLPSRADIFINEIN